jgi:hypothetical protein
MPEQIKGIHRTALWKAWKAIRKELKHSSLRDVVDHVEYDIDPDVWINRLLRRIREGNYEPETPTRFLLGKSKGFSRRMTLPAIPDLVLYRAIVDHLYKKMRRFEHRHVYFERGITPSGKRVAKPARSKAGMWDVISEDVGEYETVGKRTFRAWLAYDQYRKYLVFKKVHPFIVTTDITNFFDSILYSRVADSLHSISAPPRMVGLLFFLLERLSIRDAFNESPRIGLPVDEFGCSRKLAHLMLFPHDDRMTGQFGEEAFVRWMDDQNIGVPSYADGLRALASVGSSLARLHLTANAKKSEILSLSAARRHFHLDLNRLLDRAEVIDASTSSGRTFLGKSVMEIWRRGRKYEGMGNWDKILKRIYRFAAQAGRRFLRPRAKADLLRNVGLAERIADYMRCTGTVAEYIDFAESIWSDDRQVYADVNRVLIESFLRLEPSTAEAKRLRGVASNLLRREFRYPGASECMALGPLLLLRFGDRRSLPLLESQLGKRGGELPTASLRACAIVFAGYGSSEAKALRAVASKLLRNHLCEMVAMLDSIDKYSEVPARFFGRVEPGFDALARRAFVDMRGLVIARLVGLNSEKEVQLWLRQRRLSLLKTNLSNYDRRLLRRLWPA